MNRGYAGFYNGIYLRSSYEYAYAKYLDFSHQEWKYEVNTYDLGYKQYKPDFFLYDTEGNIIKIVEVKSRNKKVIEEAKQSLGILEENFGIKTELISYKELLRIYKDLPFTLNAVITEWNTSEDTTINKAAFGELNGHYGLKHSKLTRKKIGEHTKKLWSSNGEAKRRMLEGLRNSGLAQKGKIKIARELRECQLCQKSFQTLITWDQKYCSQSCAGKANIKNATKKNMLARDERYAAIKKYIIDWSLQNKEIVKEAKFNKIKPSLEPLLDDIKQKYDIKDFRIISASVFGSDRGRKELLQFMKDIVSKV